MYPPFALIAFALAAQQPGVKLSDIAGVWHVKTTIGPSDSVVATLELTETANVKGWSMVLADHPRVPVRVLTVGGDSVVWEAGPYPSTRRVGQTVLLRSVGHYKRAEMWGSFEATYSATGKVSGKVRGEREKSTRP
ncbi:MAG TPA: hypothetical protein VEU73_10090 [Gemmatimonadales bacterium]|nr:hypothetical protein [Gemmatimonadales bacterium]